MEERPLTTEVQDSKENWWAIYIKQDGQKGVRFWPNWVWGTGGTSSWSLSEKAGPEVQIRHPFKVTADAGRIGKEESAVRENYWRQNVRGTLNL